MWLTLQDIKLQLRVDHNVEDDKLPKIGAAAEQTILNVINRSVEELYEVYGEIPSPIVEASLELVTALYENPSPVSSANKYMVPDNIDLLIKPYMKL